MGATTNYGWPYPASTDTPDVPADMKDLADAIDADVKTIQDSVDGLSGGWTTYTPAWTTSGTNPTLGNGVLSGQYKTIGSVAYVRVSLLLGTTTQAGTNPWAFSMPAGIQGTYNSAFSPWPIWAGSALLRDVSTSTYYAAGCVLASSGTGVTVLYANQTVSATAPFVWDDPDFMTFQIAYELA